MDELLERSLDSHFHRVAAARNTEDVAQAVKIAAGRRPVDRLTQREIPGDGDLRERGRSLHAELGAVIGKRLRGKIQAASEVAHIGQVKLIDHLRIHDPGFGEHQVLIVARRVVGGVRIGRG